MKEGIGLVAVIALMFAVVVYVLNTVVGALGGLL